MPDSPRCLKCLDEGKNGQTYWNLNTKKFKCSTCQRLYERHEVMEEAMTWRDEKSPWYEKVRPSLTKVGQKPLDEIRSNETRRV